MFNTISSRVILATSGCGGGSGGPRSVYNYLSSFLGDTNTTVYSLNTIPNSVEKNVQYIIQCINNIIDKFDEIYLMGWSMGGATIINVAHRAITNKIKGIILLATQGAETSAIHYLNIPIIFIHGKNDTVLSYKISLRMYEQYKYSKKLIFIDKVNHNFGENVLEFAATIAYNIHVMFFPESKVKYFDSLIRLN